MYNVASSGENMKKYLWVLQLLGLLAVCYVGTWPVALVASVLVAAVSLAHYRDTSRTEFELRVAGEAQRAQDLSEAAKRSADTAIAGYTAIRAVRLSSGMSV